MIFVSLLGRLKEDPMEHFCFRTSSTKVPRPISALPVVLPGQPIMAEPDCLKGHGTLQRSDGSLVATVAGVVERVNKLVTVKPLRSRYVGEVGDVVVCRITEVGTKRWKADVCGRQHAVLMLSSINLPGGEQRRRTAEDQLNMRQFYVEGDLVSAEVQAHFHDGSMSIHTRSLKYGKLSGGVLVSAAPALMKRLKQHFHLFEFGVHAIFGMNGYVWLSPAKPSAADDPPSELNDVAPMEMLNDAGDAPGQGGASPPEAASVEERERVSRARNAVVALDKLSIVVSPVTVEAVYLYSVKAKLHAKEMLLPQHVAAISDAAIAAVSSGALLSEFSHDRSMMVDRSL